MIFMTMIYVVMKLGLLKKNRKKEESQSSTLPRQTLDILRFLTRLIQNRLGARCGVWYSSGVRCSKCKEDKPPEMFYKNRTSPTGLHSYCRKCGKEYMSEWKHRNPGYMEKRMKKWRRANPDYAARWRADNEDSVSRHRGLRRARENGVMHEPYSRAEIIKTYPRCLACHTEVNLSLDHVVPISRGGPDTIDNIQVLCGRCNSSKRAKYHEYRPQYLLSYATGV